MDAEQKAIAKYKNKNESKQIANKAVQARKELMLSTFEKSACNITRACKKANISRKQFYVWISEDADFKTKIEELRETLIDCAEEELYKQIMGKNFAAIKFFLETKGRSRGYGSEVKITGDTGLKQVFILGGQKIEFE